MTGKYDIVIVGGGAAGLTCAWKLSEKTDADIALLEEKESIGRNVTPGTLNMEFVNRLKGWGFSKAIERTYTRLGLYTVDESAKFDLGGKPIGASINYGKFCRLLAKKSGADIFTGTKAGNIERTGYGIRINGEFDAKLVIDASGAALLTQKKLGARPPRKYFIVSGARFSNCSIRDASDISFIFNSQYSTGGGWFYPIGKRCASAGIAFLENFYDVDTKTQESGFRNMRKSLMPFSEYLDGAEMECREWGIIPVEPTKTFASDRVLAVGDAAGHAFPLLGEGFRPTVESAIMCSDFAAQAYGSGNFDLQELKKYEVEWKRINAQRYLMERISQDIAFGRTSKEWSDFTRRLKDTSSEDVIRFIGGDLRDKTAIRRKLPKKEALKAALRYIHYQFFDRF